MPTRTWLTAYCAWMASLGVAYFLVPSSVQGVLATVMTLSAAAAVAIGVRWHRPVRAGSWLLLSAALITAAVTRAFYVLLPGQEGSIKPGMYPVHVLYVSMLLLYIAGLLGLARQEPGRLERTALIDAGILTLGLGLVAWIALVAPLGSPTRSGDFISSGYPFGDVLLAVATARFVVAVRRTLATLLVATGITFLIISDLVLMLGLLEGVFVWHTPADIWWMVGHGALGAAALHPSMQAVSATRAVRPAEASTRRLALLAVAALIPPAILVIEWLTGSVIRGSETMIVSIAVVLLVLARLTSAVYRLRQQSAREQGIQGATAALVAAADPAEVEAALDSAVRRLVPTGEPHRLVLVLPESGELDESEQDTVRSGIVPASGLPPSIAARLDGAATALVYPLVKDAADGAPRRGLVIVGAQERHLVALRLPMATLAAAATLALERIRLSREVIRSASEAYFRTLVQNAADVILVLDDDGRVRYASPSAATVFGDGDLRCLLLSDLIENGKELQQMLETSSSPIAQAALVANEATGPDWTARAGSGRPARLEVSYRDLRTDPTIRARVLTLRDVTERRRLEAELTWQAFHDPLTGLPNRALFTRRAQEAIAAGVQASRPQPAGAATAGAGAASAGAGRAGTGVTGVLLIDLDEFKLINDAMGHDAGDAYLIAVGERLSRVLPPNGVAARIGGDEFAALVVNAPNVAAVDDLAARLVEALGEPIRLDGQLLACGASIGVSTTTEAIPSHQLIHQADLSLYAAKEAGKGRYRHYEPQMHTAILHRLELRSALEHALRDDALTVEYQPIVRLADGGVVGFEALLRWRHPTRGELAPGAFIDAAEESGLIVPIGDWVLRTAVAAAAGWRTAVPERAWYVSVNVSARQFRATGFVDRVRAELAAAGLPAAQLMLEITESLLLRDDDRVWEDLHELREMGVRVAIDDFGTGYSALSYLRQVPLDVIKIDRLFTSSIASSPAQRALFGGIVNLAHTLGLAVVVEGVETETERVLAAQAGCSHGQGYLFARPMPDADVRRVLATRDLRLSRRQPVRARDG